jgi:branched-chain amino acid transport system ATP-binding protein
MLEINNIDVYYGNIQALSDVSINIEAGKIVVLIGANGAGKTTIIKTITGLLKPVTGTIKLEGVDITGMTGDKIVNMGIAHSPEGRRLFGEMTVRENLKMGAYRLKLGKKQLDDEIEKICSLFPILREREKQPSAVLSGGEQQMLSIGRALMAKPKMMLFDEPSMGLAPVITKEIFNIIKDLNKRGITILLVEQNAYMALSIADFAYVLENGRITLSDTGKNMLENRDIKQFYLGGRD